MFALVLAAGGFAAWSSPTVREELANSFTRQDKPLVELYFIELPSSSGGKLRAQVAVTPHGDVPPAGPSSRERAAGAPKAAPGTFVLKTEAGRGGKTLATGWVTVRAADGRPGVVDVAVPEAKNADTLRVTVTGRSEYIVGRLESDG
ncbi:hypothetical protein ACIBI4_08170 [Streptomyces sp. NPDC050418]|uniref:hypothetical protein n=1 Tax=Streptomyces sp. NPDC050418 TaxID=3365612 RepID=UPI0037BB149A